MLSPKHSKFVSTYLEYLTTSLGAAATGEDDTAVERVEARSKQRGDRAGDNTIPVSPIEFPALFPTFPVLCTRGFRSDGLRNTGLAPNPSAQFSPKIRTFPVDSHRTGKSHQRPVRSQLCRAPPCGNDRKVGRGFVQLHRSHLARVGSIASTTEAKGQIKDVRIRGKRQLVITVGNQRSRSNRLEANRAAAWWQIRRARAATR